MIPVDKALQVAETLDKSMGMVAGLIGKLKAKPDLAAAKLGQALTEVQKTLQAVDGATVQFLSLGIDENALARNSSSLLAISAGSLAADVEYGRGHCHVIGEIYDKYLDKWFAAAFDQNEYNDIRGVFGDLAWADADLFKELGKVAEALQSEAEEVLGLVFNGDEPAARLRVRAALPVLSPLRKKMFHTLRQLYAMQSDFIEIAGAV